MALTVGMAFRSSAIQGLAPGLCRCKTSCSGGMSPGHVDVIHLLPCLVPLGRSLLVDMGGVLRVDLGIVLSDSVLVALLNA